MIDRPRSAFVYRRQQTDRPSHPSISSMIQKVCIDEASDRRLQQKVCAMQQSDRSGEENDRTVKQRVYSNGGSDRRIKPAVYDGEPKVLWM